MTIKEISEAIGKPEWWLYQLKCVHPDIFYTIESYNGSRDFLNGYIMFNMHFETYREFATSYSYYLDETPRMQQKDILLPLNEETLENEHYVRAMLINIRNGKFKTLRTKLKYIKDLKTIYKTFRDDKGYISWLNSL